MASAGESEKKAHELGQWHPVQASYMIHSGGTAYAEPPTETDRGVSVFFVGQAAKQMFDMLGPDAKEACGDAKGGRERRKKGVFCTYTARLENAKNSHYRCWIGIDLRTGEGQVRTSC
jgi:hypothetical protein